MDLNIYNSNSELIEKLISLVQLDIDAYFAYEAAIDTAESDTVRLTLSKFKKDHKQHIENLRQVIERLGGTSPEMSPDLKGYLIEGVTKLRGLMGTKSTLLAMQKNEELTTVTYCKALGWNLPPDIRAIIDKNFKDESNHLQVITQNIENEIWEPEREIDRAKAI
jgi:uncharacterized protein (TIGR02284 family)